MRAASYSHGNHLTLLHRGAEFFPALVAACDAAHSEIYLETYIFAFDITGEQVKEALLRAAARGVAVQVLVDWLGTGRDRIARLKRELGQAGIHFAAFNPWFRRGIARMHRKIVVVDHRIAFLGGLNINDEVGATHPQALVEAVQRHRADVGIALDGDADRLQIVDASGRLFNGDELLYLMVSERLDRGVSVPGAVGTLMTNMAVEVALARRGVEFVRAKVGDRYVLEVLAEKGWLLGGEGSGHLLALDKHTTGDGLVSALQVLQACVASGKTLAELLADVQLFPQTLINVRLQAGFDWKNHSPLQVATREAEAALGSSGRVLIRASGTEPLVRVMVEARDAAVAQATAERIAATLKV